MGKWASVEGDVAECFPTIEEDPIEACLRCEEEVEVKQRKSHVGEKHLELSVKCPLVDCPDSVSGSYNDVLYWMGCHKVGAGN